MCVCVCMRLCVCVCVLCACMCACAYVSACLRVCGQCVDGKVQMCLSLHASMTADCRGLLQMESCSTRGKARWQPLC